MIVAGLSHGVTTPPLAHPSHWIAGLLYLTPVLVLAAAILWQRMNPSDPDDRDGADGRL